MDSSLHLVPGRYKPPTAPGGSLRKDSPGWKKAENKFTATSGLPACVCVCVWVCVCVCVCVCRVSSVYVHVCVPVRSAGVCGCVWCCCVCVCVCVCPVSPPYMHVYFPVCRVDGGGSDSDITGND